MKYPIWWDSEITLYNHYEDPITHVIIWTRTVISQIFWKYVREKLTIGEQVLEADKIICRIPEDARFLQKHEWVKIPNDQMSQYFTLARGDIVVHGEVMDTVDEYVDGSRSTDLISKYKNMQGCFTIESISLNTGLGRVYPHYLIEGI